MEAYGRANQCEASEAKFLGVLGSWLGKAREVWMGALWLLMAIIGWLRALESWCFLSRAVLISATLFTRLILSGQSFATPHYGEQIALSE